MIKSMTGYGRTEKEFDGRKITLEISTVNHRYCDINIRMPRTLVALEDQVRKMIKQFISRGKVELNLYYTSTAEEDIEVVVNESVCSAYVESLRKLGKQFELNDDLGISDLLKLNDVVSLQKKSAERDIIWPLIEECLKETLSQVVEMRRIEGEALKDDLMLKIQGVEQVVAEVEKVSPDITKQYQIKLEERLSKLLEEVPVDESRLALEVATFADKSCIDEEITRLRSHIAQLLANLKEGEQIGRKLDFLMQEMNREANTIASKANNYQITNYAVTLKTEIEKIREQIQNIE